MYDTFSDEAEPPTTGSDAEARVIQNYCATHEAARHMQREYAHFARSFYTASDKRTILPNTVDVRCGRRIGLLDECLFSQAGRRIIRPH